MKPFHIMAKPNGPMCNLDWTYCYYLEKENIYAGNGRDFHMRDDVLENYIRRFIQTHPSDTVQFTWQGGEPTLLGVSFFEHAIALQTKYANGKKMENGLQTNGTLLDDTWGAFLAGNKFLVGLSIDGLDIECPKHRFTQTGCPSAGDGLGQIAQRRNRFCCCYSTTVFGIFFAATALRLEA